MGRGSSCRTKVIKQNIDQDGMSDMFSQLLGDERSLDINIIKDKYMKLKTNVERMYKLLESFKKTIYVKVLSNMPNITHYIKNIDDFINQSNEIHGNKYDYSLVKFNGYKDLFVKVSNGKMTIMAER